MRSITNMIKISYRSRIDIIQELGMEGFQTEAGGFVHDKPGVGTTGFQVFTSVMLPQIKSVQRK